MASARRTTLRFNVDVDNKELIAVNKQFDEAIKTGKQFDDTLKNQIKTTKELTSTANKLEDAIYKETGALTALAKKKAEAIKLHGQESDEVKKLDKQIKDTSKTQSDYRKELDETHKKIAHSNEIEKGIKNLKEYDKANQEGIKSLKDKGRAHDAERKQLANLSGQIEQHTGILEKEKKELNRLGKQYGEHDDRVIASVKNYDSLKSKQQGLEREFSSLGDTIGRQNPKLMRWSDNLNQMSVKLDTASRKFGKTGETMKQFGSDITSTFGAAALGGGVAITYAVKKAADFEQGMKDTEALMSNEEWAKDGGKLTELVKQQGAATKYSSVEAALGLQELVKAGVSTSDILNGGLKDGLNLATAGELDLAKASETMSTALNSFTGDTSLTATKAANLLAGAANASATDVEGMSYALSQSAAVANTVGQDFEATATTLAMLAQNGLKGSDAGTSLKTMLLNLSPQTDAAARQMEALGLAQISTTNGYMYLAKRGIEPASKSYDDIKTSLQELAVVSAGEGANASKIKKEYEKLEKQSGLVSSSFYDQAGNVKGLDEISGLLQKSLKGLTKEQQQNAMKTMFGTDAVRAAAIMAKEGAKGYDAMNTAMSNVTAADVAKQKMDTLKGSIEYVTGSMETLVTELGTALIPVIKSGAKAVETTADWFGSLNDETKETIAKWGLIGTVGATVVAGFGLLAIAAGGVVTGISRIARASSSMFGWLSRKTTALGTSKLALDVETSALNRNTIAQQRNNASRGGIVGVGGKGGTVVATGGKGKASKGVLTTVVTTGKDGLGKVGKSGLLKNGVNMGKSGGLLKGASRVGKGIPILGTVLGTGMLIAGGTDNLGANGGALAGGASGAAAGAAIGSIVPGVGTAIGGVIGGIAGAIGGEKFGASLQKSLKKHWPKDSLKSTLGKDVSKDTKSAIKAYEKLNTSATNELHSLAWSSTKITKSNTKSLKDAYANMGNSIASSLKKNVKRANKEISALEVGGSLTGGEKKNILSDIKSHYSKIERETEKSQKKINRILDKASKEKRALTEEESHAIEKEQEKMRKNSVKTLTKSAKEQRTIMSQLKADASGISAKQAASVVKNSKKARDGSVKEAEKKYKETIAMADKEFYDNKSISKAQYDAIIESAKKTKKDSVENAEEMHKKVVKQAKLQAGGQVDQVDWSTGEMLGKWAKFKGGLADVVNSISRGINKTLEAFGVDSKIPMWNANASAKGASSGTASKSKTINNQGNSIASFARGGTHAGGPAVVGEEGPELAYTPYGNARLVGQNGAEIANLESGTRILTASQTRQMMSGGLSGQMPGYAGGIGGNIKDAINTVGNGVKTVANKVTDTVSDTYNGAKNIASSAYDFVTDPGAAIDKIIGKTKLADVAGLGKAALSKVKDGAVSFVTDKLSMFGGGGGGGPITNSYGVYDSLLSIAQTIMSSPLGKGLSITSGHREGDPHDHGKHNAIDLSGFGSNGGYLNVAKWASKLPGVSYAIGDNTVFGRKYGDGKKPSWATGHMNHLHVSGTGEGGGASGSAKSWSSVIKQAAKKMKVDLSASELSGIIAQIHRESTGNQNIVQSSAVKDVNSASGNLAKGLLQYVPSTFKNYALKGHKNIFSGMDQLLAFFNNSNWRSDLPYGRSGWGPSGKRRFATGGWKNVKGQVLVGEEGPELVDLPQGSHINNNNRTNELIKKNSGGNNINFSPNISISIEGTQSDSVASQVQKAVDEAMKRAFKEFTAMFDSGVAY